MIVTGQAKRKSDPLQRLELSLADMIKIEPAIGSVIRECFRTAVGECSMWAAYGRAKLTVRQEKLIGWSAAHPALRTDVAYERFVRELAWALMERVEHLFPVNVREAFTPTLRATVWKTSGGQCHYCRCELNPFVNFTIDHVIPVVQGGTNDLGNLVGCCRSCNSSKGARTPEEWKW